MKTIFFLSKKGIFAVIIVAILAFAFTVTATQTEGGLMLHVELLTAWVRMITSLLLSSGIQRFLLS